LGLKGKISQTFDVFTLGPTTHATLIRMKDTLVLAIGYFEVQFLELGFGFSKVKY
jgi:hypothetical protein